MKLILFHLLIIYSMANCSYYTDLGEKAYVNKLSCPDCICNTGIYDCDALTAESKYRINSLAMTEPENEGLLKLINDAWKKDIEEEKLNLIFKIETLDKENGSVSLILEDYEKDENDKYILKQAGSKIDCEIEACLFLSTMTTDIYFNHSYLDKPLPIRNLEISGAFDHNGQKIVDGTLKGAIFLKDADEITVLGSKFSDIIKDMGAMPDLDTDEDNIPDAWSIKLLFEAEIFDII